MSNTVEIAKLYTPKRLKDAMEQSKKKAPKKDQVKTKPKDK